MSKTPKTLFSFLLVALALGSVIVAFQYDMLPDMFSEGKKVKKEKIEKESPAKSEKEPKVKPVETEPEIEPVKTSLYQYGGSDDLSIYQGDTEILNFYVGIKGGSETVYLEITGDFGGNEIIIQPEIIIDDEIIPIPIEIIANELGQFDLILHAKKLDSDNGVTRLFIETTRILSVEII